MEVLMTVRHASEIGVVLGSGCTLVSDSLHLPLLAIPVVLLHLHTYTLGSYDAGPWQCMS